MEPVWLIELWASPPMWLLGKLQIPRVLPGGKSFLSTISLDNSGSIVISLLDVTYNCYEECVFNCFETHMVGKQYMYIL